MISFAVTSVVLYNGRLDWWNNQFRFCFLDTEEDGRYRLISEEYDIDMYLSSRYMEAIGEAGRIMSDKIDGI